MLNTRSLYSSISLILSVLALVLALIMIAPYAGTLSASETITRPSIILIYLIYLFLIGGMILSMMSFKRNETPALLKWSAFILNLLLLILIVASIIFAMSLGR